MLDSYHVLLVILVFCLAYLATYWRLRQGNLTMVMHRRIWNLVLSISFLVTAFSGLILAAVIDLGLRLDWYRELLWAHVEFGLAMTVVGLFHAGWHWPYFLAIFKQHKMK